MDRKSLLKIIVLTILGISILILFVLLMVPNSPVQTYTLDFMNWIGEIPKIWGVVIVTLIYAISLIFCIPGTPINLAAGFLFGPILGSISTVLGCDLGAIFSFFISRNLTREWAEAKMKSNKTYGQIDIAVAKNGFLIIFLLRLSPVIPFGICNYLFGATKVTFSKYWLATTAGLIPCTVAYTYIGSLMRSLTDIYSDNTNKSSNDELLFVTLATIFTTVIIVVITVVTKRTLKSAMEAQQANVDYDLEKGYELHFDLSGDGENNQIGDSGEVLRSTRLTVLEESDEEDFINDKSPLNKNTSTPNSNSTPIFDISNVKKTNLKNQYTILENQDELTIETIK